METSVKERLIAFLKYNNLSQAKFANQCNLSTGFVNAIHKSIGGETLHKISMQFPELNTGWLLTGEGEMLRQTVGNVATTAEGGTAVAGNGNHVVGNGNHVVGHGAAGGNGDETLRMLLEEMAAQRRLTETTLEEMAAQRRLTEKTLEQVAKSQELTEKSQEQTSKSQEQTSSLIALLGDRK